MSKRFTGVILAAGVGKRMGRIGESLPKACLPLGQAPLIHHHLELLRVQGVARVVVVVGYRHESIRKAVDEYSGSDAFESIEFVEQSQRLGIAHALLMVESMVPENMIVILGDTYFIPDQLMEALEIFERELDRGLGAVLSVRVEPNPAQIRKECSIRLDTEGRLLEIKEKPKQPFNELKPCGMYFFSTAVFDAIRNTPASELRNEVEISDTIQTLANSGRTVRCASTVRWDMNLNSPAELWWCNQVELRRLGGGAWLGDEALLGADVAIEESVLGNHVRVASGSSLSHCLVLEHEVLNDPVSLKDTVLAFGNVIEISEDDKALLPPVSDAFFHPKPSSLLFRQASERDCERLFRWVNSQDSLEAKVKTLEPIRREVHERWFRASLESEVRRIWILELEGRAVGQARLEKTGAGVEQDLYLEPRFRRQGFALRAMRFMREQASFLWPGSVLWARVRFENEASAKLCEKAGYTMQSRASDHRVYSFTSDEVKPS